MFIISGTPSIVPFSTEKAITIPPSTCSYRNLSTAPHPQSNSIKVSFAIHSAISISQASSIVFHIPPYSLHSSCSISLSPKYRVPVFSKSRYIAPCIQFFSIISSSEEGSELNVPFQAISAPHQSGSLIFEIIFSTSSSLSGPSGVLSSANTESRHSQIISVSFSIFSPPSCSPPSSISYSYP